MMRIKNCFAKDPVNLGRQREWDIAKGMAIIMMLFSHAIEILSWFLEAEITHGTFWYGFDMIISGASPIFILCMGIGLSYTKKQSAKDMLHRAKNIAIIALLLEIARTAIPGFLEWLITGNPECIEYVYLFFEVDILPFAALAMLAIALFKKLNLKPWAMMLISVICSVVGQLLQGCSTGSRIGDIAVGFIWQSYDGTFFPFLNWLILPVSGYVIGNLWLRIKNKDTFFRWVTPISWVITILYFVSMVLIGEWYYFSGGDYRCLGVIDAALMIVVCFSVIGLGYYISKLGGCIASWLESMGSRITSIYFIHWTIYCFLYLFLVCTLEDYLAQWVIIPTAILVLIASDFLSRIFAKRKRKNK